ncbi:unnamed protein product [Rotaria sp. Silwood2]|nr:unnamed protein product [Rotaria sp. Silwood2]CAF3370329.1 unnamed protein product [Rotaria sp. Silwood2]CAF4122740.1 unnamed protein product [Rotaria sp. Silwood2]CAF4299034.1 unnamed protein product [Rotaria sp. Silwood2]
MSHGIGPYFHRDLIKQLKRCEKFVLCFDEQTNVQNKKQLDLLIKFWSYGEGLVVTRYYKSVMLGHTQAHVLQDAIINSFKTDGINLKRLLMLERDNPFVNISLENLIDEEMKKIESGLLLLGSGNLHSVHNGFKTGISSANWHVENICTEIYSWFKQSPARKEDLVDTIDEFDDLVEKTLLYFTITRWILLGKVIARVLTLWEPLNEYFLIFLPTCQKAQIRKNDKYEKIKSNLTSNVSKIRLHFVLFLCETIFDRFLTWFQQEGPLIHLLHHELSELFHLVSLQFLKSDYVADKSGSDLLDLDFNADQIIRVARAVPHLLTDNEIDHLRNEWLIYSYETIDEKWIIKSQEKDSSGNDHIIYQRIDFYWNNVLAITLSDGRSKYPTFSKLVKNILIISHGNADIERGFSINENIVTTNRSSLSELSINGLRTTYDAVKFSGGGFSHKACIDSFDFEKLHLYFYV